MHPDYMVDKAKESHVALGAYTWYPKESMAWHDIMDFFPNDVQEMVRQGAVSTAEMHKALRECKLLAAPGPRIA